MRFLHLLTLWVTVTACRGFAQSPFSADVDSLIRAGIDRTLAGEFEPAMNLFETVIAHDPRHPAGYFYQAATLQSRMMDYETDLWEREFFRLIDLAIDRGETMLEQGDDDAWTWFYVGSSYSYKGLYQGKNGSLVPGFISARKGIGNLEKAMERNPGLYDAWLGVGSYKYWSGRFYQYLRFLPWIRDEREQGIAMIRTAVEKGLFSRWVGVNTLGWILYDNGDYEEALALFQSGLNAYSGSRFFLWGVADCLFRLHRFEEARAEYERLLESIRGAVLNNGYNEAECRMKLMYCTQALGDYAVSLQHARAILGLEVSEKIAGRIKSHRKAAREYVKMNMEALGR